MVIRKVTKWELHNGRS